MGILKGILVTIEVITGVLLVGVILLQKSKDEGLGLAFGAGVGETLFGSRAGNVLTKITIGLATVFLVNTLLIGYLMSGGRGRGSVTDSLPAGAPVAPPSGPAAIPEAVPESAPAAVPAAVPAVAPAQPEASAAPAPAPAVTP